jgi:hypothetical protein
VYRAKRILSIAEMNRAPAIAFEVLHCSPMPKDTKVLIRGGDRKNLRFCDPKRFTIAINLRQAPAIRHTYTQAAQQARAGFPRSGLSICHKYQSSGLCAAIEPVARIASDGPRRRSLCAQYSSRGNILACRPAAQTVRSLAVRNPNKSQVFPVKEPNGNRRLPPLPGRSSLPFGRACSAWGSSNRVPKRTPDQQR